MKNIKKDTVFKTGIWIKEQQGQLTIGSLDEKDETVMIIPDDLCLKIFEFENDMMDALYGEEKIPFNRAILDVEKLFENIGKKFKRNNLRISFSGTKENVFKGEYDEIYHLIETFIQSSITDEVITQENEPVIYINASVLQDHLCIIYRDSASISVPSKLKNEIGFIKSILNGEVSHKVTSGNKSYYDIIIPSKP